MFGSGDSSTFTGTSGMFTLDFPPLQHDSGTLSLMISHQSNSQICAWVTDPRSFVQWCYAKLDIGSRWQAGITDCNYCYEGNCRINPSVYRFMLKVMLACCTSHTMVVEGSITACQTNAWQVVLSKLCPLWHHKGPIFRAVTN